MFVLNERISKQRAPGFGSGLFLCYYHSGGPGRSSALDYAPARPFAQKAAAPRNYTAARPKPTAFCATSVPPLDHGQRADVGSGTTFGLMKRQPPVADLRSDADLGRLGESRFATAPRPRARKDHGQGRLG